MDRCRWVTKDPDYINYHDFEWGKPVYEERKLFEMLTLEGAQAGLSWITILKRRENYQNAFDNFDYNKISRYSEAKINELMNNSGIIRNQKKINSVVQNATAFLHIEKEQGSFSKYLWEFVNNTPIINHWQTQEEVPTYTELSLTISNDLKKRGFSFVGPTIIYSFMQAIGMVNDHLVTCFCHPLNQKTQSDVRKWLYSHLPNCL